MIKASQLLRGRILTMNFGTIFSIVETIISQAPKAWSIIKAAIADVEAATDPIGKLKAIATALENALAEIKSVLDGL